MLARGRVAPMMARGTSGGITRMAIETALSRAEAGFAAFMAGRGALSEAQIDRARRVQAETGERFVAILSQLGLVAERELSAALAEHLDIPTIPAVELPETALLADVLSRKFLKEARAIPVAEGRDGVVLAMADPLDDEAANAVAYAVGAPVLRRVVAASDFAKAFARLYGDPAAERMLERLDDNAEGRADDVERLQDLSSDAPVIRLVNLWIEGAIAARASDIHIEAAESAVKLRYRIDGNLREIEELPSHLAASVASRVKIMARLNIAERRLPQDGKFRLAIRGRDVDVRVSIIPTVHGESIVLRILDRSQVRLDFASLGYDAQMLQRYLSMLERPHGILLVTGPTGSGKTTTLYASLLRLKTPETKILTVEDPIEYQIDGINQTQVHPQIGLDFAGALRSFLRHDPDIILVGEIRDLETARIAVQSALTGHLVLSTLHTNDAASSITRLIDMGVEDYLITATVVGIAAQRLVRQLCPHCRVAYTPEPETARALRLERVAGVVTPTLYRAKGCAECNGSGFRGRLAVAEILPMSEAVRGLVMRKAPAQEVLALAQAEGMETMYENGLRKCLDGLTTIDEVLQVTAIS